MFFKAIPIHYRRIPKTLRALGYGRKGDKDLAAEITQRLKRLIGRSGLTGWEMNMLLGLCSRAEKKFAPKNGLKRENRPAQP